MSHAQLPVVVSPTRAELGLRCHRRHFLSDVLEYGKCKSPSAAFGSVMHAAAAVYWTELVSHNRYNTAILRAKDEVGSSYSQYMAGACSIGDHTQQRAETMLDVYVQQAELAGPFTSVGQWRDMLIEQRLLIDIGEHKLSFQQDRSVYNKDLDWLLILDLKTASQFSPAWRNGWSHSLQMKLYKWAAAEFYATQRTDVIIEGLLKATKPKLLYLPLPDWSPALLKEAVEQFKRVADKDHVLIERALRADGSVDMDLLHQLAVVETEFNDGDCSAYGYQCPFRPLCDMDPEYRGSFLKEAYSIVEQDY